eukprot:scaffold447_cov307-Pinguiococcus_pyrenoidosus.AAC.62
MSSIEQVCPPMNCRKYVKSLARPFKNFPADSLPHLGLAVKRHQRPSPRNHVDEHAEDLLARPQRRGLQDCRLGHGEPDAGAAHFDSREATRSGLDELIEFFSLEEAVSDAELYARVDVILNEPSKRGPVGWHDVLLVGRRNEVGLRTAQLVLGKVAVDLVAVEICVVRVAVGVVHPDRLLAWVRDDADLVSHDAWLMQRGLPIHQHHVPADDVPVHSLARLRQETSRQCVPLLFRHPPEVHPPPLRHLDEVGPRMPRAAPLDDLAQPRHVPRSDPLGVDQGRCKPLRNANLCGPNVRVRGDHRPARMIHALAHHVLPKQPFLPLQQLPYADRLIVDGRLVSGAVDEDVDRILQRDPVRHHLCDVNLLRDDGPGEVLLLLAGFAPRLRALVFLADVHGALQRLVRAQNLLQQEIMGMLREPASQQLRWAKAARRHGDAGLEEDAPSPSYLVSTLKAGAVEQRDGFEVILPELPHVLVDIQLGQVGFCPARRRFRIHRFPVVKASKRVLFVREVVPDIAGLHEELRVPDLPDPPAHGPAVLAALSAQDGPEEVLHEALPDGAHMRQQLWLLRLLHQLLHPLRNATLSVILDAVGEGVHLLLEAQRVLHMAPVQQQELAQIRVQPRPAQPEPVAGEAFCLQQQMQLREQQRIVDRSA